jgi:transcription-repair coupling factor (superfamily II helicase)
MKKIMKTPVLIDIKNKNYPSYKKIQEHLVDYNYLRVPIVLEPGDFAVRGSIIDIYPINQSHPIRIEYYDDEIDRLNSFDIQTQRSISNFTQTEIIKNNYQAHSYETEQDIIPNLPEIISQFSENDFIVHEDYGIGQFQGLIRKTVSNLEGEYVQVNYKGKDKLFIPLNQINRLHKYGDDLTPTLTGLHDGKWKKATEKALEHTQEMASEIYEIYKNRLTRKGNVYEEDTENQLKMELDFPYDLTKDQKLAIEELKADMESPKPMDRLICGDVGFGKTEVVLRAAFKALENLKQVALLCPTTVLAKQHVETFKKRLEPYGYKVEMLSRLVPKKQQDKVLLGLKNHTVDMVIGTHRLLQKDIDYADLGLLIVDEEQRFGVKHKETIKKIKLFVDIISVSATPIPRTLYMSLNGAKDVSLINTPPKKRKPIICTVSEENDDLVKNAIMREIERNGQVFFIHNRVKDIYTVKLKLEQLLPNISIIVAHGQMHEKMMINAMNDFTSGNGDLLLCTTIIENGMDIPNANTIIIKDADKFGLSQIHQLRGRVGRSERQAFAYMFYNSNETISDEAKKRLRAVKEYLSLGSGYQLAMKDLEIRGAGNLLGKEQSGHLNTVGFTLYCKLLENAICLAKGEEIETESWLSLNTSKIKIQETYIHNPRERLALYTRMMKLTSTADLENLKNELTDRYGKFNEHTTNIFDYLKLELNKEK